MKLNKLDVLIDYIQEITNKEYIVKPEYSTNYRDKKVIIVEIKDGEKVVFFGNCLPLYNYFEITIFDTSIREAKETSEKIGNLIGQTIYRDYRYNTGINTMFEKWKLIFKQNTNPQTLEYKDIRRVGYNLTLQCVINKIYEREEK